ncbi:MAG: 4Fe-4S dicluster domain-containing protein [Melioribacteraceae bacterium]
MNSPLLRKIRIALSLVFFIATTFLFVDIFNLITPEVSNKIVFLQFVPSALKFIALVSFTTFGFLVIFLLTILFGRVYCSSICPLGTFQDVVNNISGRIKREKKRRFNFLKELRILRLSLLALPIVVFIFGSAVAINLLDPYSIYGRFAGNFFRPILAGINNLFSSALDSFKVYWLSPFEIHAFHVIPFAITFAFFALVFVMAWKKGRLYCNTICPVGTLLGYISKLSLFRVVIKEEECLSCGACARECKASCIDSKNKTIDVTRCVDCFNCLTSCPTEGITYTFSFGKNKEKSEEVNNSKRDFLTKTSLYLMSFSAIAAQVEKKIKATKPSTVQIFRKIAVSPPGSVSVDRFNSKCTACHLCVSACPTQVLQPSFLEYGFTGMLQPRLDNIAGFCNFECKVCGDVCPTGAILPLELEKKKLVQLGKAKFIEDNCIVKTEKTDCGACSEHCPTKAVHMIPYEGKLVIPEVREKYCIGCGACEYACPVTPYKAIYVEGNSIHIAAEKNTELKVEKNVNLKEEFPF